MNSVEVVSDTTNIDNLNKSIQQSPANVNKFFVNEVKKGVFVTDLFEALRKDAPPPQYPLTWKSDKQRKFVMAKLRRENNLPYRRSAKLRSSWKIVEIVGTAQGELRAVNETPYVQYVMGIYQQPMFPQHQHAPTLVQNYGSLAAGQLRDGWQQIAGGK